MVVKALELGVDVVLITVGEQGPPGPGGGGGGSGSDGHTIQEDGVDLTARPTLNFGAGIDASDDVPNDRTNVTVSTTSIGAIPTSARGAANGVAALDVTGKVPAAQLPPLNLTTVFVAASEAEMLALPAVPGDSCVRTDLAATFALVAAPASTLGNWVELLTGGSVGSVNGQTGAVVLDAADVGAVDLGAIDAPNGVAGLDGSGLILDAEIPGSIARDSEVDAAVTASMDAHLNTVTDAHPASAISLDTSAFDNLLSGAVVNVQLLAEVVDEISLPVAIDDATYLIATTHGSLPNAITVGTSPGGELAGSWDTPTVQTVHSGSSHASIQSAAEATAAAALTAHAADTTSVHGIVDTSLLETQIGSQNKVDTHVNDTLDAHDASAISLDTSGFAGLLDGTATQVQFLADRFDALTGAEITIDASGFSTNLGAGVVNVQLLAEAVDLLSITQTVDSVNGQTGIVVLDAVDVGAIDVNLLGQPDGVATLDATGKLSLAEWPPLVTTVNGITGEVLLTGADIPLAADGFTGNLDNTVTDVQLLAEAVDALTTGGGGGGGAPTDATYLTTTSNGTLTNEVVVGTSPGGELGGSWASPTVDATHSGSSHASVQAAAEATAAAALSAHASDTTAIHGIADTSLLLTTASIGTTVQGLDGTLTALAGLTVAANKGIYATGADAFATYDLTAYARSLGAVTDAEALSDLVAVPEYVEGQRITLTPGPTDSLTITVDVDMSDGVSGGDTWIGGTGPSDSVTIGSTLSDTRGTINLRDRTRVITEDKDWTDATTGFTSFVIGNANTVTLNDTGINHLGDYFEGIRVDPVIEFEQNAFAFFAARMFAVDATIGNVDTVPVTLANSNIYGHGAVYQASNANVDGLGVIAFGDAPTFQKIGSCTLDVTAQTAFYTESTVGSGVTMTNRYGVRFIDATGSGIVHNQIAVDIAALSKGDTLNYGVRSPNANVLTTIYGSEASGGDLNLRATTHATTGTVFIHDEIEQRPTTQTFSGVPNWYRVQGTYSAGGTAIGRFIDINPTVLMTSNGSALINGTTFADRITYKNSGDFNFGTVTSFQAGPTITVDTQLSQSMDLLTGAFIAPTLGQSNSGTATLTDTTGVWWAPVVGTGWTVTTATALKVANPTGSGGIGTLYGLDIATLTRGGTNVGIRSPNTNILTTIYGSEASGGDLNLRATTHATTGTIFLHDEIEQRPTDQSFTATPSWFEINNTYTMDMDPGSAGTFVAIHPTVIFSKPGSGFGSSIGFSYSPTVKTAAAGTGDFSTTYGALFAPTYQADTLTGRTITLTTFAATPTISGVNNGTITLGSTTNFSSTATVTNGGATVTIPTLTHFAVVDATGTGAVTNQYGLDIPALVKGGTTNIGIRSLGTNVVATLRGSESSGGHLNLHSTTHATTGDIQLDNKSVELLVTDYTNGGTNSNYTAIFADNTITMSSSGGSGLTGNAYKGISYTQLIDYTADGHLTEGAMMFRDANTYRADGNSAINTGIVYSFQASPNLHGTSSSGTPAHSMLSYQAYASAPIVARAAGSGSMTITSMTQFNAGGPVIGQNTSVGTRTGVLVAESTFTSGGGNTFTTQVGVDIAAMTAAGTNIGLRNKSQTQLGSSGQCTISTAGAIATSSSVLSSSATAGIGYATGAGGTASQTSSKSTAFPTISKVCGTLTWNNAALGAHTGVTTASSTNTAIASTDAVVFTHISGGTLGAYTMTCTPGSGTWTLTLLNHTGGSLSEAPVFAYAIIKAVTS